MSSPMDVFMTDDIVLIKKDGSVIEGLKAQVTGQSIICQRVDIPFEEGDKVHRPLPNGLHEVYLILEANYNIDKITKRHDLSHTSLVVRKEGSLRPDIGVKLEGCKIDKVHTGSGDNK